MTRNRHITAICSRQEVAGDAVSGSYLKTIERLIHHCHHPEWDIGRQHDSIRRSGPEPVSPNFPWALRRDK